MIRSDYVNMLFYGDPGTGKTALANAISASTGMPIYEVTFNEDSEEDEFEGKNKIVEGKLSFVETAFLEGFANGGILLLEEYGHAKARGARIYAEVVGYGATCDAYHMTAPAPDGSGGASAMALALADGGIRPEEVDYINAHGTSTPLNDKGETAAVKAVFGDWAYRLAMSSTKSMTGHMLGAAGAVEAIFSALALVDGYLPATIHYREPDPECDLDVVPNAGRNADLRCVLSNSLGFGGHNASLLFQRWEGR